MATAIEEYPIKLTEEKKNTHPSIAVRKNSATIESLFAQRDSLVQEIEILEVVSQERANYWYPPGETFTELSNSQALFTYFTKYSGSERRLRETEINRIDASLLPLLGSIREENLILPVGKPYGAIYDSNTDKELASYQVPFDILIKLLVFRQFAKR